VTQATWLVPEGHRSCGTAPDSHRLRCGTSAGVYVPGCARIPPTVTSAAILTIGNEVVSGDVTNTNATWLAQRLETLGVRVLVAAAVPDEEGAIGDFVRRERVRVDHLIVTGGLGGTPDDITREALAAAFGVKQQEVPELAAALRARFPRHPDYAARWAQLPVGAVPLDNPHGGAPGFRLENVWVLPGLPSEMEAMFDAYADQLRGDVPISAWRRAYRTRESDIVQLLTGATVRWPQVSIGSYPRFLPDGPEVEVVLKAADASALAAAVAWLQPQLDDVVRER
jgi:molybdenum cofactor synthesis domain-containing protein